MPVGWRVAEPAARSRAGSPPEIGINNTPLDYEYVQLN
jgi:hypothetical protein